MHGNGRRLTQKYDMATGFLYVLRHAFFFVNIQFINTRTAAGAPCPKAASAHHPDTRKRCRWRYRKSLLRSGRINTFDRLHWCDAVSD